MTDQQHALVPGSRVTWADDSDTAMIGTVRSPNAEESAQAAHWADSTRAAAQVLVQWDDLGDRLWIDADELRPLTTDEAVQAGFRGDRPCPSTCPCWTPGAVCEEWMGLADPDDEDDHEYCPRCGWVRHLHPDARTESC